MGWICLTIMVLIVCGSVLISQYMGNKKEDIAEEESEAISDRIEQLKQEIDILLEEMRK